VCHDLRVSAPAPIRLAFAPCLAAAVALLLAAPAAPAATTCKLSLNRSQQLGATYVTNLRVRGVTCAAAQRVAKTFHSCRRRHGLNGRCTSKVLHYGCTDKRPANEQIPTQLNGHVTCKRGSRRVTFDYQQNL
jgi:hypothetical protein